MFQIPSWLSCHRLWPSATVDRCLLLGHCIQMRRFVFESVLGWDETDVPFGRVEGVDAVCVLQHCVRHTALVLLIVRELWFRRWCLMHIMTRRIVRRIHCCRRCQRRGRHRDAHQFPVDDCRARHCVHRRFIACGSQWCRIHWFDHTRCIRRHIEWFGRDASLIVHCTSVHHRWRRRRWWRRRQCRSWRWWRVCYALTTGAWNRYFGDASVNDCSVTVVRVVLQFFLATQVAGTQRTSWAWRRRRRWVIMWLPAIVRVELGGCRANGDNEHISLGVGGVLPIRITFESFVDRFCRKQCRIFQIWIGVGFHFSFSRSLFCWIQFLSLQTLFRALWF